MKRFFPYILILLILVGVFSPVSVIHSQTWLLPLISGPTAVVSPETFLSNFLSNIFYMILSIVAFVLWLAGTLLDYVMKFTIIDMRANIQGLTGINIAWKVVKDLMNIAFIFLLVFEGIKMIIGSSGKDSIKKIITGIVLAALLINFSLFFTKVLIDTSNIITVGFYNSILARSNPIIIKDAGLAPQISISGISVPFMHKLGLSEFWSKNAFKGIQNAAGGNWNSIIIPAMGIILFLIVAFIFFAVSILFIVRYLTLIILLVLSPVAYMGMALPFMKPYADRWWESLSGQLLFAPLYMVMTWIILELMGANNFITTHSWGSLVDAAKNSNATPNGPISLVFNFAIIIGLVIASLIIAKSTAKRGANQIGDATKKLTTFAGGAVMGGAAAVGRRTVGASASRISESQTLQNWAGRSKLGEFTLNKTRGVANSSFDTRASRLGESLSNQTGIDLGKAKEGGYNKTLDDKTKRQEKFGDSLRGNVAKEQYATRIAGKTFTRGGSNSSVLSGFGLIGRSDRVVASKILNKQLEPLDQAAERQQAREVTLNQQEANIRNEISTLGALLTPNAAQTARLTMLSGPAFQPAPAGSPIGTRGPANRSSLAYIQEQLNTTRAESTNTTNEANRIRGIITTTGLVNTDGVRTAANVARMDTLNRRLARVNAIITAAGGTPTPAQQVLINRIQNQINAIPGDPSLGVYNTQNRTIRGRRADEQNF